MQKAPFYSIKGYLLHAERPHITKHRSNSNTMRHYKRYTKCLLTAILSTALYCLPAVDAAAKDYVPEDYVWTSPSQNSAGSMPCGGHDVGMNIWVEGGDVLFYVARSGMFDENNTLLKAGRWRLSLSSAPFGGDDGSFSQTLRLADGAVYIKGRDAEVRLWADVYTSAVYMEVTSKAKTDATLCYESWRYKDRPVSKAECQQCSYKWILPKDCTTFADSIRADGSRLDFWHENRSQTVFDFTVSREQLDDIKQQLYNPIGSLRFGGRMSAPGFTFTGTRDGVYASTDYRAWQFKATGIRKSVVTIALYTGDGPEDVPSAKASRKRSAEWWHAYWQRSNIQTAPSNSPNVGASEATQGGDTNPNSPAGEPIRQQSKGSITNNANLSSPTGGVEGASLPKAVRNYELFRYMLGCNAYGQWPTKFNGGLFTFDPVYVDPKTPFTPDYRKWGGGTMTAQNQRLVYWPMLKSGDTDMMVSQFDTYLRLLPNAVARTKHYWGHGGASFCEQLENFGLPNPAEYGKHKPGDDPGMERNAWLEYQWDTALEFCSMILQAHFYTGMNITKYEPLIIQCLQFFDEHYQYLAKKRGVKALNAEGKLVIFPSSGCETYKMAYNPSSVVAALRVVTEQFERYKAMKGFADVSAYALDSTFKNRLPEIPLCAIGGDTCIAPAVVWERIQNVETPQLYPVFPWRVYGMGRDGLQTARNTYRKDPHAVEMRTHIGWKQDNIWAACLGLTDEAVRLNTAKLADGPYRFPAFWEPGYDWAPDHNRGGGAMIGLQEMLLQETPDGELMLFPAWPKDVDACFRLHATGGRIVEAEIKNGKITSNVIVECK